MRSIRKSVYNRCSNFMQAVENYFHSKDAQMYSNCLSSKQFEKKNCCQFFDNILTLDLLSTHYCERKYPPLS